MNRVASIISSRCIGYQLKDGTIIASVHSSIVRLDSGATALRYWLNGDGARRYEETSPRVDRPMAERPRAED